MQHDPQEHRTPRRSVPEDAKRGLRSSPITSLLVSVAVAGCCGAPLRPTAAQPPRAQATQSPTPATTAVPAPPSVADPGFLAQYAATFRFRLGKPRSFAWLPDGSELLYLRSPGRSFVQRLYALDPATGEERVLLTAERLLGGAAETLSAEEKARRERQRLAARGLARFALSKDGNTLLVPLSGRVFLVDRKTRQSKELALPGRGPVLDPRLSPDGRRVAWVRGGELWALSLDTHKAVQLTQGASKHVTHGLAEFVAQEEMGRHHGYWWSPDSRMLVYQRTDTSGVERMHVHDPLHPERPGRGWPYPRPGKANAKVRLGVVPATGGATAWLDWDRARWPYLTRVRWSKGAPLTVVVQNRAQSELVVLAKRASGGWDTLVTETDSAWLNLDSSMPRWIDGGRHFLWSTERGGSWQLELRAASGALVRTLTRPQDGYRRLLAVDSKRRELWLSASAEPTTSHVARLPLGPLPAAQKGPAPEAKAGSTTAKDDASTSALVRVTTTEGWHGASVAKSGDAWLLALGPRDGPARVEVHRRGGGAVRQVRSEAEAPGFPVQPQWYTVGPRKVRAVVLRPRNHRPGRRYPVIVYAYGGPHYNVVRAHAPRFALQQWLADHGFVVCSFDGRGTPWRGRAWERATRKDLLSAPLADQAEALRALARELPEMDLARVGVFGWSFGGTFASAATIRLPELFKAGVAGAPVTDWRDYDTHYTERYLGLPGEPGHAYRVSSPIHGAEKLKGKLMLVHGTADDNVWFSHSVKLSKVLFEAGVAHQFVPLPGHTHMVRDAKTLEQLYARMIKFFHASL